MLRRVPRASWTRRGLPSPGADTQKMMGALVDRKLAQGRAAAIAVPVLQRAQELVPLMCDHRRGIVAEEPIDARKRAGPKFFYELEVVAELVGREVISQHASGIDRKRRMLIVVPPQKLQGRTEAEQKHLLWR